MRYFLPIIVVFFTTALFGQFKENQRKVTAPSGVHYNLDDIRPLRINGPLGSQQASARLSAGPVSFSSLLGSDNQMTIPADARLKIIRDQKSGLPVFIKGEVELPAVEFRDKPTVAQPAYAYLEALKEKLQIKKPAEEFVLLRADQDKLGQQHIRLQQVYRGVKVYGGEVIVHTREGKPFILNGRYFPTPGLDDLKPALSRPAAMEVAFADVAAHSVVRDLSPLEQQLLGGSVAEAELVIFHPESGDVASLLAWEVTIVPHLGDRWSYLIDAGSGQVLEKFSHVCRFMPILGEHSHPRADCDSEPAGSAAATLGEVLPADGPKTANGVDLQGATRLLHTYELQGNFFMIDASRPMYNAARSNLPQEPVGAIVTLDARDTSPEDNDFSAYFVTSANNSWNDPTAVSAHFNAGTAYEYFRQTFNRNSINGQGGTIYSIINVVESDGTQMDNAFWDGRAMYYGNGNEAFTPLARSLDVAGHEMSHGVIQSTANLDYRGESGALNESFADIFGVLIDRDDWTLGEEVVKTAYYPSGALRDMADPHNGGTRLGDPGWQPEHTDEQYFGSQDNGGVHINSGIPNRAFYLFANQVGREKAEQVYYRALNQYLVRSSQFVDLRAAVLQAAADLYDNAVVTAAGDALTTVGITGNGGGDYQQDVDENPGTEYILVTNDARTDINIVTPGGDIIAAPLIDEEPLWKPSITDDGQAILYIGADKKMKAVLIDWEIGEAELLVVQDQAIWRSAAISRDGSKIAALTDAEDNQMVIFDLIGGQNEIFELYNPTFTQGVQTGSVNYAEAMEWDFSGQFVMYDANNSINTAFGQTDYWDISFVQVWDNASNQFTDPLEEGIIFKLINDLPDNTSVGNPTFSKNSPYIVAFDFLDDATGETLVLGGNIETGDVGIIAETNTLGYPSFSNDDTKVILDELTDQGGLGVAVVELESSKIEGRTNPELLFTGASWANWFAIGERVLTSAEGVALNGKPLRVFPNPFNDNLTVEFELDQSERVQVELFDLLGRRLYYQSFDAAAGLFRQPLILPGVVPGNYLLRVNAGSSSATQKILKAR